MTLKPVTGIIAAMICWTAVPANAQALAPSPGPASPGESRQHNDQRALMAAFIDLLLVEKKPRQAYEKYADPQMVQRNPAMGKDRASTIQSLETLFSNPEAKFSLTDIYVDGPVTIANYNGRLGAGLPSARVVEFFRWKDSKIVEHWDVFQVIQPSER